MHSSWSPQDSQAFKTFSQPVAIPAHRRSKSSLEYRVSPSSASSVFSTPDMVPDVDQSSGNVVNAFKTYFDVCVIFSYFIAARSTTNVTEKAVVSA